MMEKIKKNKGGRPPVVFTDDLETCFLDQLVIIHSVDHIANKLREVDKLMNCGLATIYAVDHIANKLREVDKLMNILGKKRMNILGKKSRCK